MKTDKIYLVGFMAAGKSTVGKALANRLQWAFRDLDELIEEREQLSVAEFFSEKGEAAFRKAEATMLEEIQQLRHAVVATGGGTLESLSSRYIYRNGTQSSFGRPNTSARLKPKKAAGVVDESKVDIQLGTSSTSRRRQNS